jgi:hypothetical protein
MSDQAQGTTTWPELGIALYDKLTGRGAEITYEFDNMEVSVPSSASANAAHANWKVNGTLKIRTKENSQREKNA